MPLGLPVLLSTLLYRKTAPQIVLPLVELSGFLGTKIHGLSTDVQCETLSQHRSITMTQFPT
ncbi:hypothetical protein N657DRAFT_650917 [Parathielavia appendiculata]|uniref:Uncharacterized protein n=1 Tax=Parathielavia appendiculata TaxID=2587402 RepID=A0AAN6TRM6_9PEZI|nr:hypothetical protein N657DRAFT_650917 [Parathielavia appendiculata]